MTYTESVRRVLSDKGWLHPIRTSLRNPVEMDELSCPECESDHVLMYEKHGSMVTVLTCESCGHKTKIDLTRIMRE